MVWWPSSQRIISTKGLFGKKDFVFSIGLADDLRPPFFPLVLASFQVVLLFFGHLVPLVRPGPDRGGGGGVGGIGFGSVDPRAKAFGVVDPRAKSFGVMGPRAKAFGVVGPRA